MALRGGSLNGARDHESEPLPPTAPASSRVLDLQPGRRRRAPAAGLVAENALRQQLIEAGSGGHHGSASRWGSPHAWRRVARRHALLVHPTTSAGTGHVSTFWRRRSRPWGSTRSGAGGAQRRVARGGCPPGGPTDPYVRDYRIRLLGLGTRCETIDRLRHTGGWKRIPLKHRAEPIPSHPCAVRAPVQPLPPNARGARLRQPHCLRTPTRGEASSLT